MGKKRKNIFLAPSVLIAIIGFLGVVTTAYFNYLGNVKPLEIIIANTRQALTATLPTVSPTDPPRKWYVIFSYEFPDNYWEEGIHNYLFKADCPFSINSTKSDEPPYALTVKKDAEILGTMVYIRRKALFLEEVLGTSISNTINPAQATTAIYGPLATTFEDAKRLKEECKVQITIDDGSSIDLIPGRIDKLE